MAAKSVGRPKREEERKIIFVHESTLKAWNEKKSILSTERLKRSKTISNNEFALLLLNNCCLLQSQNEHFQQEQQGQAQQGKQGNPKQDHDYCTTEIPLENDMR